MFGARPQVARVNAEFQTKWLAADFSCGRLLLQFSFSTLFEVKIYTTNAIESLHMQLRKVLKSRAIFRATRRRPG